jgi:N-acetylneuraminic acid mutarotase
MKRVSLLAYSAMFLLASLTFGMVQQKGVPLASASSSGAATENSWISRSSMNQARAYLGVAVVNGKIYAIGGDTGSLSGDVYPGIIRSPPVVNTNEEYDPATGHWTIKTPMPTARAQFGVAVCQNKIYCIGGYDNNYNGLNKNEVYDPATNSWYAKAPILTPAVAVQANTVDGKIYVIGSESNMNYVYDPVNYVYDPATDSWASKTPPPNEVADRYSIVVGSKIYFIGFLANSSDVVQTYDTLNDSWSILTTSPTYPSSENGGGVTSGVYAPKQIYLFDDAVTTIFDLANDSWTVGAPMPSDRLCAGVAVVNDTFYVIGGRSGEHDLITLMGPSAMTEQYVPFGYKTDFTPPKITFLSPENKTYFGGDVSLNFTVDKTVTWVRYSLDAQDNVTITGNTTLSQLSYGLHNVTVYAQDTAGNVGASETGSFNFAKEPEPFPATLAATASIVSVVAVYAGLLIYFKKRKHQAE